MRRARRPAVRQPVRAATHPPRPHCGVLSVAKPAPSAHLENARERIFEMGSSPASAGFCYSTAMEDIALVLCPYCFEQIEVYVDPETTGSLVEDCEVCCRPWQLTVALGEDGEPLVQVTRAQ